MGTGQDKQKVIIIAITIAKMVLKPGGNSIEKQVEISEDKKSITIIIIINIIVIILIVVVIIIRIIVITIIIITIIVITTIEVVVVIV